MQVGEPHGEGDEWRERSSLERLPVRLAPEPADGYCVTWAPPLRFALSSARVQSPSRDCHVRRRHAAHSDALSAAPSPLGRRLTQPDQHPNAAVQPSLKRGSLIDRLAGPNRSLDFLRPPNPQLQEAATQAKFGCEQRSSPRQRANIHLGNGPSGCFAVGLAYRCRSASCKGQMPRI
uniref:Uncharacterized protein n=1 Tax=Sphaerodactylus townsendi TaxID=933632 RepID=A0ACB8G3R2_9SAUR